MKHPAYRIISFVLLVALAVRAGFLQLALLGVTVLIAYLVIGCSLVPAARMLLRARWLFLSILLVYLWFTPGTSIFGTELPTWEGVALGAHRAGVLALVILLANLLVQRSTTEELLAGLYGLTAPLGLLGFPRERFAVRAVLTLDYVMRLRSESPAAAGADEAGPYLSRLESRLQRRYGEAVARARSTPLGRLELPAAQAPTLADYAAVAVLASLLILW
jgi:energy-coupling factor transporter transmembrane protein EcfT